MNVRLLGGLLLGATLCSPAFAADTDALQGKWKADKEIDGKKVTYNLEIKADQFSFELKGSDGASRLHAKGKVKVEKLGAFKTLTLLDIKGGQTADDLQSVDDTRAFVYVAELTTLTLAANFDRERGSEGPNLTVYRKQ